MTHCPNFNGHRLHAQDFKLCSFKIIKGMIVDVCLTKEARGFFNNRCIKYNDLILLRIEIEIIVVNTEMTFLILNSVFNITCLY